MNRELVRKLAFQLSLPFPFQLMRRLSGQNFIFPFYHVISNEPSPLVKHLYPVPSEKQFRKDLDFLLKYFFPATFDEVLIYARKGKYKGKPKFFLSFDDGFSECFHVIAPVLKKMKIPAAFFINPAFVDNNLLGHRQKVSLIIENVLKKEHTKFTEEAAGVLGKEINNSGELIQNIKKLTITDAEIIDKLAAVYNINFEEALHFYQPYMNSGQISKLQNEGFLIGSHSFNHPEFNLLSEDEMKIQFIKSFQFLESEFHIKNRIFSFPFNDIGVPLSFFQFLQDENVRVSFGTSGIKHDNAPCHLQRIPAELKGFPGAEAIIRSEYFYYLAKAPAGKNFVKRK